MIRRAAVVLALLACTGMAMAQNTTERKQPAKTPAAKQPAKSSGQLSVGDAAPALRVEKWVKGTPVRSFQKGKVYVVEFWATWCGPCQKSIPHLTELQKKHRNLTVIGMASSEQKKSSGSDRRAEDLGQWVRGKKDQLDYTIGYEGDQQMYREWMTAAGRNGIPCAFVVGGDGKVAWIGNPLSGDFDGAVDRALDRAKNTKSDSNSTKKTSKDSATSKDSDSDADSQTSSDSQSSSDSSSDSQTDSSKDSKRDSSKDSQKDSSTDKSKSKSPNTTDKSKPAPKKDADKPK